MTVNEAGTLISINADDIVNGEFRVPLGIHTIDKQVFYSCTYLMSVIFSDSVTRIDGWAFSGCINLVTLVFSASLRVIGNNAFSGCINLENLILNDSVEVIEAEAFGDCSKLERINLPNSISTIEHAAFSGCMLLADITLPDSVRFIGRMAFACCAKLTHMELPSSLTIISAGLFIGCTGLKSISLPKELKVIEYQAFMDCSSLNHIIIPDSVQLIGEDAFNGCTHLVSIQLPDALRTLGKYAFDNCPNLRFLIMDTLSERYHEIKALLPKPLRDKIVDMRVFKQREAVSVSQSHWGLFVETSSSLDLSVDSTYAVESVFEMTRDENDSEGQNNQLNTESFNRLLQSTAHNLKLYCSLKEQGSWHFFSSLSKSKNQQTHNILTIVRCIIEELEQGRCPLLCAKDRLLLSNDPYLLVRIPEAILERMGISPQAYLKENSLLQI